MSDTPDGYRPLKLRAETREDLHVIAASLQDAIVPRAEMAYEHEAKRFALVASRFVWEVAPDSASPPPERDGDGNAVYYRVQAGLAFEQVRRVSSRNLDGAAAGGMLELLTIDADESEDGAVITLVFAGDGQLRLEAARVLCHLTDLSAPWPTPNRPEHADLATEAAGDSAAQAETAARD